MSLVMIVIHNTHHKWVKVQWEQCYNIYVTACLEIQHVTVTGIAASHWFAVTEVSGGQLGLGTKMINNSCKTKLKNVPHCAGKRQT